MYIIGLGQCGGECTTCNAIGTYSWNDNTTYMCNRNGQCSIEWFTILGHMDGNGQSIGLCSRTVGIPATIASTVAVASRPMRTRRGVVTVRLRPRTG